MTEHLVITGRPRTKKTHSRLVRAGGRPRILPSAAHAEWFDAALWQLRARSAPTWRCPVQVAATFFRDAERGDLVGYLQALADLLQAAQVVTNDVLIRSWDGSRLDKDASRPRIECVITAL